MDGTGQCPPCRENPRPLEPPKVLQQTYVHIVFETHLHLQSQFDHCVCVLIQSKKEARKNGMVSGITNAKHEDSTGRIFCCKCWAALETCEDWKSGAPNHLVQPGRSGSIVACTSPSLGPSLDPVHFISLHVKKTPRTIEKILKDCCFHGFHTWIIEALRSLTQPHSWNWGPCGGSHRAANLCRSSYKQEWQCLLTKHGIKTQHGPAAHLQEWCGQRDRTPGTIDPICSKPSHAHFLPVTSCPSHLTLPQENTLIVLHTAPSTREGWPCKVSSTQECWVGVWARLR